MSTSALTQFLFPAPAQRRAPAAIFAWWESRRLGYNAVMAVTGVFSLGIMSLFASLPPASAGLPPLPLVLVYAFVANVFYCLGPVVESALEFLWPGKLLPTGPALFRMGLTFSVGLNFFGMVIMAWDWLVRVVNWMM